MNKTRKNILLLIAVALIVLSISYLESKKPRLLPSKADDIVIDDATLLATMEKSATSSPAGIASTSIPTNSSKPASTDRSAIRNQKALKYPRAKELVAPSGFINTDAFKLADIVGKKVILIDFWTYSCINCQRTIPYLKQWYEKYESDGLVIIGVHTPEFDFEKNYDNVARAVKELGVKYPVVLDSDMGTWNAYGNNYWPREFLIDIDGFVVHDHIGEGGYAETEKAIQAALEERGQALKQNMDIDKGIVSMPEDIEAASPETYLGSARSGILRGKQTENGEDFYVEPLGVKANTPYLIGTWKILPEYAETGADVGSKQTGSDRIDYRYTSKRVYFVAGSPTKPVDVEILRDGKPLEAGAKGSDVFYRDGKSYVKIQAHGLYKIIEDETFGEHLLELIIPSSGLQAFTFTFG